MLDEIGSNKSMQSEFLSRCDLIPSRNVASSLAHLFAQAASGAVESEPGEVYWRMSFIDAYNVPRQTIYIGKTYSNTTDVTIIIEDHSGSVPQRFEKWLEDNIDFRNCTVRPGAEG